MIDKEEYILLMKMKDINRYNEIKKEKIDNKNYIDIIEEEKKIIILLMLLLLLLLVE